MVRPRLALTHAIDDEVTVYLIDSVTIRPFTILVHTCCKDMVIPFKLQRHAMHGYMQHA